MRRALSPTGNTGDAIFRILLLGAAVLMLLIVGAMILALAYKSRLSISQFGFGFITGSDWDPVKSQFGALPFIYGTIMSSLIAIVISVPLSLGIAIFLVEQAPRRLARPLTFLVELLAAIPSVVYGLWGIFVLAPFLRVHLEPPLQQWFGWLPLFKGPITGIGLLTGGIILAIMVTPIISAVVRDVLAAVPSSQREAALALGATKWETTRVVLVNGTPGIAGAVILGLPGAAAPRGPRAQEVDPSWSHHTSTGRGNTQRSRVAWASRRGERSNSSIGIETAPGMCPARWIRPGGAGRGP